MSADPVVIETTRAVTKTMAKIIIPFILIGGFIAIISRLTIDRLYKKVEKFVDSLKNKSIKTNGNKCPSCGGLLLEKSGQYGRFFGCSNYPTCRFTKKIN